MSSSTGQAGHKSKLKTSNRVKNNDVRFKNNLVNLLVTCVVLFAGVQVANGSFINNINWISESLDRALYNVLVELQGPDYTPINITTKYHASTHFNAQGMGILYNITSMFMDAIVDKDIYPEGLIVVEDSKIKLGPIKENWRSLLIHFIGILVIATILLLLGLFLPICGFCFCCCRCCGNCGAKSQPLDKKRDCCKKFVLATLLIAVGTLLLFGVVCAFVTNQHIHEGAHDAMPAMKVNVKDVDNYLNVTGLEINILLGTNFREFQANLFDVLNRSSEIVFDQLAKYSNAVAMTEVTNIVQGLGDIKSNLTQMKNITNFLRNHASQLNDALRKVKNDLIHTLKECNDNPECSKLSSNVSNLDTNIDFNSLPDLTKEMRELEDVMQGNITTSVELGQQKLQSIEATISDTVSGSLRSVKNAISGAGRELNNSIYQIMSVLENLSAGMHNTMNPILTQGTKYITEYAPYAYYGGIAVSCILLSITFCIAIGLICGICGKKSDPYSEDCCNKRVGSQCLICGVGIIFLAGIILAVITIVFFIFGVFSQRIFCESLRNYEDSRVINLVDSSINYEKVIGLNVSIKQVLYDCHRNRSAYTVFRLNSRFDLEKVGNYLDEFDIENALNDLQNKINVDIDTIEILSDEAKNKLNDLANSSISDINFDRFTTVLDDNLTKVDLNILIDQLTVVIDTVSRRSVPEAIKTNLEVSKLHLETYQEKLVIPMTRSAEKLIDIAKNMDKNLKFGKVSFKNAIEGLVDEVQRAEEYLKINGTFLLSNIARNFTLAIRNQVVDYLDRVVYKVSERIGQCGPLSNVFNATLTSTCDKILQPLNGVWFVLFWSLLIFIITIILSVKLASLYKKYDPYSYAGESEYLYDAYADREIIPLASNGKSNKKKKKTKRQEGRTTNFPPERDGDHGPRDFPGGSNQENRYADMAPKQQWEDFPNGGPPQYQRAPTEYERPPPYYYPGSGDQQ